MSTVDNFKARTRRLFDEGQFLSALHLTEILCELEPSSKESHLLCARALFEVREFDNVLRTVKKVLDNHGCDTDALVLGMKAAFEIGELKQCINYAEELAALCDTNVSALCYLAKCAELTGDTAKAVSHYRSALEKDAFCGEAIDALIERRLLDNGKLLHLISILDFPSWAEVLRDSYRVRVQTDTASCDCDDGIPKKFLLIRRAHREYQRNNHRQALSLTTECLEHDPYYREAVCLHLCLLVDTKSTPKLFEVAHFLSKSKIRTELALYAIGCYYYSLSNYERAGRYFSRATELDCVFVEAWIACGHCYAKLEEGERALSVYQRVMMLFPGMHYCFILLGMQYSRMHQFSNAMCFLGEARTADPNDPLVLNEIGVIYTRTKSTREALQCFQKAYDFVSNPANPSWHRDCIVFNLATVQRKMRNYEEAIYYFSEYITYHPNASHGHCALAFTYHLAGNIKSAIAHYHTALTIKNDSFCRDMLDRALATDFGHSPFGAFWLSDGVGESPSPGDVSFSTASNALHRGSATTDSGLPSDTRVGRSLMF